MDWINTEQKRQKVTLSLHWNRTFVLIFSESVGIEFGCEVWKFSSPAILVIDECNMKDKKKKCPLEISEAGVALGDEYKDHH